MSREHNMEEFMRGTYQYTLLLQQQQRKRDAQKKRHLQQRDHQYAEHMQQKRQKIASHLLRDKQQEEKHQQNMRFDEELKSLYRQRIQYVQPLSHVQSQQLDQYIHSTDKNLADIIMNIMKLLDENTKHLDDSILTMLKHSATQQARMEQLEQQKTQLEKQLEKQQTRLDQLEMEVEQLLLLEMPLKNDDLKFE